MSSLDIIEIYLKKKQLIYLIADLAAMAIPQLGPFISLIGAFCLSLLAMVFPGVMDACVCYAEPKRYGPGGVKLIRDIFIIAFGTFCMCAGVYTSIMEIIHESKDDN